MSVNIMNEIITCPNCGQKNRVTNTNNKLPICSQCWTQLEVPLYSSREPNPSTPRTQKKVVKRRRKQRMNINLKLVWLTAIICFVAVCMAIINNQRKVNNQANQASEEVVIINPEKLYDTPSRPDLMEDDDLFSDDSEQENKNLKEKQQEENSKKEEQKQADKAIIIAVGDSEKQEKTIKPSEENTITNTSKEETQASTEQNVKEEKQQGKTLIKPVVVEQEKAIDSSAKSAVAKSSKDEKQGLKPKVNTFSDEKQRLVQQEKLLDKRLKKMDELAKKKNEQIQLLETQITRIEKSENEGFEPAKIVNEKIYIKQE